MRNLTASGKNIMFFIFSIIFLCILFTSCGQAGRSGAGEKEPEDILSAFTSVTLTQEDNPELDFGLSSHDKDPVIRDFAVTPEGTILILQLSENICEYDFSGNLLGIYRYGLQEQGMTAFRIAAGNDGLLYLLDGRNNSVITVTREKIVQTSVVSWTDLGSVTCFGCDASGRPFLSATDPDVRVEGNIAASFTFVMDVSGVQAVVAEKRPGKSISENSSFQAVSPQDTGLKREMSLKIYRGKNAKKILSISSPDTQEATIAGVNLHGYADGRYLAEIIELSQNSAASDQTDMVTQTYLLIDSETGAYQACECTLGDDPLVRFCGNVSFYLQRGDGRITIAEISSSYSAGRDSEIFDVTAEDCSA